METKDRFPVIAEEHRDAFLASVSTLLADLPVPYAIVGSVALLVERPDVLDTLPPDVDLVVSREHLKALVTWALERDGTVTSWKNEITDAEQLGDLSGRFYLRIVLSETRVDVTYELPRDIAPATVIRSATNVGGLSIARIEDVAALMKARSSKKDLARLKRLLPRGRTS